MADGPCPCWVTPYRLGHEGHCCFIDGDRGWRPDEQICHVDDYVRDRAALNRSVNVCPTPNCPGDVRYAAPGRGHKAGCTYPNNLIKEAPSCAPNT